MEKSPGTPLESNEGSKEKVLTSTEVLEALSQYAEGFTVLRELTDELGVYLLEVEIPGEKEGETIEYQYKRKNTSVRNPSDATLITMTHFADGIPIGGNKIAQLDEETGEWRPLHTGDLWG